VSAGSEDHKEPVSSSHGKKRRGQDRRGEGGTRPNAPGFREQNWHSQGGRREEIDPRKAPEVAYPKKSQRGRVSGAQTNLKIGRCRRERKNEKRKKSLLWSKKPIKKAQEGKKASC